MLAFEFAIKTAAGDPEPSATALQGGHSNRLKPPFNLPTGEAPPQRSPLSFRGV